jgi:hypothetical protein
MTAPATRADAPVFVVGCPRSGTTLLYHMLLSSGGFAVYRAEASVFNLLAPRFGNLASARRRAALLDAWLPSELFRRSGLDPDEFRRRVLARCRSAGDLLRLFMEDIARRQQVTRWAECTPENLLYAVAIKQAIPDAVFLHIIRDGRDVACSLAEQRWIRAPLRGPDDAELRSGLFWEWIVRRGRTHLSRYAADTLEVRFESLLREPGPTLDRVSAFLRHDLDYERIRREGIGSVTRPNTSFPDGPARRFEPVGRWRGLDSYRLARLEGGIGGFLDELGYALESDPGARVSARSRLGPARRLTSTYFSGRHWLKTRTPLGRVFTNTALLADFRAFDRDRAPAFAPKGGRP